MHQRSKLLLAALTAALLLAIGAGTASANRSLRVTGGERAISATAERLSFRGSNGINVISDVTLNGRVNASIGKGAGSAVGTITEATTANISNSLGLRPAGARALFTRGPWAVTFRSFTGTLPAIRTVLGTVVNAEFLVTIEALEASYRGNVNVTGTGTGGAAELTVTTLTEEAGNSETLVTVLRGEEFFRRAPPSGVLASRAGFRITPNITVTLG
jgi:hypothetical protein